MDELVGAKPEDAVELGVLANPGENVGCDFGDLDGLREAKRAEFVKDRGGGEVSEVAVKYYARVLKVE